MDCCQWYSALLLLPLLALPSCQGGRILVFPVDGSHWVNMNILLRELHSKGHEITVLRSSNSWYIKEQATHYNSLTISAPDASPVGQDFFTQFLNRTLDIQMRDRSLLTFLALQREVSVLLTKIHRMASQTLVTIFEDPQIIKRLQGFDVVLTDPTIAEGLVMAHRLKLPVVLNVRWTTSGEGHFAIAPSPLSYIPMTGTRFSDRMTFTQRLLNVIIYGLSLYSERFIISAQYDDLCARYCDSGTDIRTLLQSADIWLMRVDFVFEFPRPTMPNVVYMGGFQCQPAKPLAPELEKFMESSGEHGVIVMSLGTLVQSLPREVTAKIASAFAQLPQKIIWRYIGERPQNLGNNTLLVEWLPQNDLLGHPKTRAFVAHGGTNGVYEAIYHGVPVVGLPLLFDQFDNLLRLEVRGAAKVLDFATMSSADYLQALKQVLEKPSYRRNMKKLSTLHHDRPMEPMQSALFWIEYVMGNRGAAHLRTEAYKMPWYSYHSLDVIAVLLAALLVFIITGIGVFRFLCCMVCKRRKTKRE
ncbi:UDP-glucuronosyltransferase 2B31 [Acipenser ruthenus]|uniref:UDP-glucuronosyltransferase n=1 Tax=Acipenser ruthenus TaxID=7906 RepID=A0A662YN23_ACIRT|nr:UDP-glucuronosyltransferase 2B31 [Acipenser ruthenus]